MAIDQKKILVRRGNKEDLVVADLQPGEPCLALDTNEVGIKTSGGAVLWFATLTLGPNAAVLASEKGVKGGIPTLDPTTGKITPMPTPADIGAWLVGEVKEIAYDTADAGWLLCQGQAVSRTTYATLFAKIGTKYGAGDSSTTFNVPNRCGRVGIGLDPNDVDFNTLGKAGGAKTHTLARTEVPTTATIPYGASGSGTPCFSSSVVYNNLSHDGTVEMTINPDGGKPFSILPQNVVMNYEIYTGVFN